MPFFIFLAKDKKDKDEFNKFLEIKEIQEIDKRNICCFIFNKKNEEKELIIKKIHKIYSFFFEKGEEFDLEGQKIKLY